VSLVRPTDTPGVSTPDNTILLRYASRCGSCGKGLLPGDRARWNKQVKTATCASCLSAELNSVESEASEPIDVDRGEAGGSAAREWQRRHDRRELRVRARHEHLGGLILALSDDPRSTAPWSIGAEGERIMGRSLDGLRNEGIAVLHDRRIPGTNANIDHIVVSRAGVFVIDTKHYRGRVEQRDVGGWFNTKLRLYVGDRDRTMLLDGIERQAEVAKNVLAREQGSDGVPITPVLLFMAIENWSLLRLRPLRFGSVYVLWGKALGKLVRAEGPLSGAQVSHIERLLTTELPPA
jgi:hypothetical protein